MPRREVCKWASVALLVIAAAVGGSAQQTGLTDSDCTASHYRELPERRSESKLECDSEYRDWSHVAVIAHDPSAEQLQRGMPSSVLKKVQVLAHKTLTVEEPLDLIESLSGPNHYLLFSHMSKVNHTDGSKLEEPLLTISEVFNRLVMMASADVVILAHQEDVALVNEAMVHGAAQAFAAHPNMGILGTYNGYTMGGWIQSTPKLQYVAAVEMGPIIVSRSAFLEVGMLDCMGDRCFQEAIHSLSLRMLLAGKRIGLMSFPNEDGEIAARELKMIPHPKPECDNTGVESLLQKAVLKYSKLFMPREYVAKMDSTVDGVSAAPVPDTQMVYCEPEANCPHASSLQTAVLVQYFSRPDQIGSVIAGMFRSLSRDTRTDVSKLEVIVHDDSRSDYTLLRRRLSLFPRSWLIFAPNTHEIRAYNRMAKFTPAKQLVFAQDDDAPVHFLARNWHSTAQDLFRHHPQLGLLGAHRGRLDLGWLVDGRTNQISGPKFGIASDTGRAVYYKTVKHYSPATGAPFMFMYKVNAGPLIVNRNRFLRSGMFYQELSCPGEPGIGFDFEYSIRMWSLGQQVGLYAANWTGHVGGANETGTRADEAKWQARRRMEMRNNGLMYEMYPDIHHMEGTRMAVEALETLDAGEGAYKVREDAHLHRTILFLRSLQFSQYCDLLGYNDIVQEGLGACCKELIIPEPIGTRAKHGPEDYQCVQNPRQWESMAQAARSHLETSNIWLEEEAGWNNLYRYVNGTVLRAQPEWQKYLEHRDDPEASHDQPPGSVLNPAHHEGSGEHGEGSPHAAPGAAAAAHVPTRTLKTGLTPREQFIAAFEKTSARGSSEAAPGQQVGPDV